MEYHNKELGPGDASRYDHPVEGKGRVCRVLDADREEVTRIIGTQRQIDRLFRKRWMDDHSLILQAWEKPNIHTGFCVWLDSMGAVGCRICGSRGTRPIVNDKHGNREPCPDCNGTGMDQYGPDALR